MSDLDKIRMLRQRLTEIERRPVPTANRASTEIARDTLRTAISELGMRLSRRNYWRPSVGA